MTALCIISFGATAFWSGVTLGLLLDFVRSPNVEAP